MIKMKGKFTVPTSQMVNAKVLAVETALVKVGRLINPRTSHEKGQRTTARNKYVKDSEAKSL